MQRKIINRLLLGAAPLVLLSASAFAGEGVDVVVTNDGTEDIIVTVYDMSVEPQGLVLSHARINGFTTVPISVTPDASGHAKLSWTATSVDSDARKCGHGDNVALGDSALLSVHADSSCST